jgi:hypothetical protein
MGCRPMTPHWHDAVTPDRGQPIPIMLVIAYRNRLSQIPIVLRAKMFQGTDVSPRIG